MSALATLVYLHGFRSSPASIKARQLAVAVAALPRAQQPLLHIPALHHRPGVAMAAVVEWIAANHRGGSIAFIGSSLGGYYATHLAERYAARAVIINPSVRPYDDLAAWRGTQHNMHTGEAFTVTDEHFDELRVLDVGPIADPARYLLMVQSGDEVLDWRVAVARYGGAWQYVAGDGDHAFSTFADHLAEVLAFIGVVPPRR